MCIVVTIAHASVSTPSGTSCTSTSNAGADFDISPKTRFFLNLNYLRFDRTEPLELILFEHNIRHDIGLDYGLGVRYRPPLSENIVITFGAAGLSPGQGFRDIYTGKQLWSVFTKVDFVF